MNNNNSDFEKEVKRKGVANLHNAHCAKSKVETYQWKCEQKTTWNSFGWTCKKRSSAPNLPTRYPRVGAEYNRSSIRCEQYKTEELCYKQKYKIGGLVSSYCYWTPSWSTIVNTTTTYTCTDKKTGDVVDNAFCQGLTKPTDCSITTPVPSPTQIPKCGEYEYYNPITKKCESRCMGTYKAEDQHAYCNCKSNVWRCRRFWHDAIWAWRDDMWAAHGDRGPWNENVTREYCEQSLTSFWSTLSYEFESYGGSQCSESMCEKRSPLCEWESWTYNKECSDSFNESDPRYFAGTCERIDPLKELILLVVGNQTKKYIP